jgi:hypothetical protein
VNGEEAAEHEKHLDRVTRILAQPGDQVRRQCVRVVGHRPVEGEMMQDDQLRGERLERVDERQSRGHSEVCRPQ